MMRIATNRGDRKRMERYRPGRGRPPEAAAIRPSSLVTIRWIAAGAQAIAVCLVAYGLKFDVALVECFLAIGALVLSNIAIRMSPIANRRLTQKEVAGILAFDLLQLGTIVGFTGGLENPFALLLLAPVTVSATVLSRGMTMGLTVLALAIATVIGPLAYPLPWSGPGIQLPTTYVLGIWTSLAVALVFIASYVWTVSDESRRLSTALGESEAALAKEREMSSLGALAAAAAHELGSPLATIAVVAKELKGEVPPDSPLYEDIDLLHSQSDRCRDILVGLARRPAQSSAGDPFDLLPISSLTEIAVESHVPEGIALDLRVDDEAEGAEPVMSKSAEFLHGVGNFVSNAGQYAKSRVEVDVGWTGTSARITVRDDGPGFPPGVLDRLGEPYLSTRQGRDGHMGLGVFIAATLLERTGCRVVFRNRQDGARGAEVEMRWDRSALER